MSSTNRRRLGKEPPQLNATVRTKRTVRAQLTPRSEPDAWLLARAFLALAAHERQQQERSKPQPAKTESESET